MTNGEKLCIDFPNMHYTLSEKQPRRVVTTIGVCASFDLEWWNAEYQESSSTGKGYWIEHPHEWGDNWQYSQYECSCCHNWAHFDTDYCPYCGAEMDGVKSVKRF